MPDSIAGLPLHPLLVHAPAVIVSAAAITVLLAGLRPRFRRWSGPLRLGLAVAGLILDPLSTSSGESLERRVGHSALIGKHSQLADGLLPWMAAWSESPPSRQARVRRASDRASLLPMLA